MWSSSSHRDFLLRDVLVVVFVSFLVEAAGVPFPSRILLLIAATVAIDARHVAALVGVARAGSLIGDRVPYLAGAMTGPRILALCCWVTLGSEACVDKTVGCSPPRCQGVEEEGFAVVGATVSGRVSRTRSEVR